MAVTGTIFAIPCMPVLGTLAIIFMTLADQEFASFSRVEDESKIAR